MSFGTSEKMRARLCSLRPTRSTLRADLLLRRSACRCTSSAATASKSVPPTRPKRSTVSVAEGQTAQRAPAASQYACPSRHHSHNGPACPAAQEASPTAAPPAHELFAPSLAHGYRCEVSELSRQKPGRSTRLAVVLLGAHLAPCGQGLQLDGEGSSSARSRK